MTIQRHSGAAQTIGYHIPNMKEEPNTGANNYPNMNAQQDDMSVRVRFTKNICATANGQFELNVNLLFRIMDYHILVTMTNKIINLKTYRHNLHMSETVPNYIRV